MTHLPFGSAVSIDRRDREFDGADGIESIRVCQRRHHSRKERVRAATMNDAISPQHNEVERRLRTTWVRSECCAPDLPNAYDREDGLTNDKACQSGILRDPSP